jgi:hypothetical protein
MIPNEYHQKETGTSAGAYITQKPPAMPEGFFSFSQFILYIFYKSHSISFGHGKSQTFPACAFCAFCITRG